MNSKLSRIPIHKLTRNPQRIGTAKSSTFTKGDAFQNTLTSLSDPESGRKLTLIGTTNSSTTLAYRTQRAIEELRPDRVLVQTSEKWAALAKGLRVQNQEQFNALQGDLCTIWGCIGSMPNHARGLYFKFNLLSWMAILRGALRFPASFNPLVPGLEMKFAIDAAHKVKADLEFIGGDFDGETLTGLSAETHLNPLNTLINLNRFKKNELFRNEFRREQALCATRGGEAYAESIDTHQAYWWSKYLEQISPEAKKIIIDVKDDSIFNRLYRDSSSQHTVAVVNQWHVPGVAERWLHATSTIVRGTAITSRARCRRSTRSETWT